MELAEMISPPALAKKLRVHPDKIAQWIRTGELVAVNIATTPNGRPRYKIREEEVERFLESRSTKPPAPKPKRRRRATTQKKYF
jgi:excisionase family DNA binding protein